MQIQRETSTVNDTGRALTSGYSVCKGEESRTASIINEVMKTLIRFEFKTHDSYQAWLL